MSLILIFKTCPKLQPCIWTSCWKTTLWNFMRILFVFCRVHFMLGFWTHGFSSNFSPQNKKHNSMFDILLQKHGQFSNIFWKVPTFWPSRQEPPWVTARCRRKTRTNVTRPTEFLGDSSCRTHIPPMGLVYVPTWMVDLYGESRQIYQTWILWGMITSHVFCWQTTMGSFFWWI